MNEERIFYVYVLFRQSGVPCYVGKGKGSRWRENKRQHNPYLSRILREARGNLPTIILADNLSEENALALEKLFIDAIGRIAHGGPLVNFTDGGEGVSGFRHSNKTKLLLSAKSSEMWANPNSRRRLLEAQRIGKMTASFRAARRAASEKIWADQTRRDKISKNKKELFSDHRQREQISIRTKAAMSSPEVRDKISAAQKRRFQRPKERERQSPARLGKKHSAEALEKIAAANRGKKRTPEARAKMGAWQLGRKMSEESRRRMSVSAKARCRDPLVRAALSNRGKNGAARRWNSARISSQRSSPQ